ncbi:MAG: flippase [Flavobacteriaceae bacterium]|nr:flippase [Flavobacteriaceae bacterium]
MIKPSNSNKKEILLKGIEVFFIRVLGYGCGFLFTWLLANKYGAKTQGVFAIAFMFLSVGAMISKLGIETAIVKWIARHALTIERQAIYLKSLKLIVISSLITALFLFFLAPLISSIYNKPDIELSIKIAAISIPFLSILDVSASYFKGIQKTGIFGLYAQFFKFFAPFVFIVLFYTLSKSGFEIPIISYSIGLFLVSIIAVIHVSRALKLPSKIGQCSFKLGFKSMILDAYPMMISSAIVMIMGWSDVFVLGFYAEEHEIGVYNVAVKLSTIVSFTYNAVATIATPKIALYYKNEDTKLLRETIGFSSRLIFFCGLPIFTFIFIFPEFILSFFGLEFVEGKTVLRILLIAQLTNVITGPVGAIFQMTEKQKILQNYILIALVFNVVFSLILVRFFYLEGVAIASAIGMMLWNVLGAYFIWKNMKIKTWVNFNNY